ncbi:hypothetical protein ACSQ67_001160 [Phaseolus vulgaris]
MVRGYSCNGHRGSIIDVPQFHDGMKGGLNLLLQANIVLFFGSDPGHHSNIVLRFCEQAIVFYASCIPSSEAWKMRQDQDPANSDYVLHQLKW